jgi:hypothetical protein
MKCRRDEIWEPLFYERWGKIIGPTAFTAWERMVKGENARIESERHAIMLLDASSDMYLVIFKT